mgnify:CR=1 FL=1
MAECNLLRAYGVCLVGLVILFVFSTTLDDDSRKLLLKEGGPVEV